MGRAADTGRRLEQQMAAFLLANGYEVRCNEVLEGRSGGRHEIDVLAERSDAVTTYRVAVECKAWQQPIEKDVVSKLHYVMGDLGLHKGIVVSLAGWRSGAERAADELGIELWGPAELRRHLGDDAVAGLEVPALDGAGPMDGSGTTVGLGVPFGADSGPAERQVRWAGTGRWQLRTVERVSWFSTLWLPAWSVRITVAQEEAGRHRIRSRVRSETFDNLYDALDGTFLGETPALQEIEIDPARGLRPAVRDTAVHTTLRKAVNDHLRVTTPAAVERHAAQLEALGLPAPCSAMSIDATALVHLPFYAGILDRHGEQRVVAVAGDTGRVSPDVSRILTVNLAVLRARFDL